MVATEQLLEMSRMERMNDSELRGISSFQDALDAAAAIYGGVEDIAESIGNGFTLITDKRKLVGTPFLILSFTFNPGEYGDMFASVAVVTESNDKFVFNDGSTGICAQLRDIALEKKRFGGFLVKHGLRVSEYATCVECNAPARTDTKCTRCGYEGDKRGRAETFYLDGAA